MRRRPGAIDSGRETTTVTSRPAFAQISAIPAPIWPQPTTPTRWMSGVLGTVVVMLSLPSE